MNGSVKDRVRIQAQELRLRWVSGTALAAGSERHRRPAPCRSRTTSALRFEDALGRGEILGRIAFRS